MSRVATIELLYTSDLSKSKAEYNAFREFVESNPIRVKYEGGPNGSSHGPASTFNGATTSTGGGSISTAERMATPPGGNTVNHYYGGNGAAPTSIGSGNSVRMPNMSNAQTESLFSVNMDYGTADMGSHGQFSGGPMGPWKSSSAFGSGKAGGGSPGDWSKQGLVSALADQGIRGASRLLGVYSMVNAGFDFAKQRNQLGIDMGGATSTEEAIGAWKNYGENSPAYGLPILGDWFRTINESVHGDRAKIASTMAGTKIGNQNFDILNNSRSTQAMMAASTASASGSYAGQRSALSITNQNTVQSANIATSQKVTELSSAIEAITAGRKVLPKEESDKVAMMRQQIKDVQSTNAQFISSQSPLYNAQLAAINRQEDASVIGSRYTTLSLNQAFGNSRGSAITAIQGSYRSRMAGTGDIFEYSRLQDERDATLRNESAQYGRETGFMSFDVGTQRMRDTASIFSSQHRDYEAGMAGINANAREARGVYDKETAGLDASDPMQAARIKAAQDKYISAISATTAAATGLAADYQAVGKSMAAQHQSSLQMLMGNHFAAAEIATDAKYELLQEQNKSKDFGPARADEHAANRLAREDQKFGVNMGTLRLHQATLQQLDRNEYMPITANVRGDIANGVDAIYQANHDLRGDENKEQREARIKEIRANTLAMVQGEITPAMRFGGRLETVSAFVTGGDRNNQAFRDFQNAQGLGEGAGAALDAAASPAKAGPDANAPTAQQQQTLITLTQANNALLQLLQ